MADNGTTIYMLIDYVDKSGYLEAKAYENEDECFADFNSYLVNYGLVDEDGLVSFNEDGWGYMGNTIRELFKELISSKRGLPHWNGGKLYVRCS